MFNYDLHVGLGDWNCADDDLIALIEGLNNFEAKIMTETSSGVV